MKKISLILFICSFYIGVAQKTAFKVGSNPTTLTSSAILEVESTTKGFLPPRMTKANRDAIATPVKGLVVYCTDCSPVGISHFNGTSWGQIDTPDATTSEKGKIQLAGDLSGTAVSPTVTNAAVIGKVLTNYTKGPGTVAATDNILEAIQKLDGNANPKIYAGLARVGDVNGTCSCTVAGDILSVAKVGSYHFRVVFKSAFKNLIDPVVTLGLRSYTNCTDCISSNDNDLSVIPYKIENSTTILFYLEEKAGVTQDIGLSIMVFPLG